MQTGQSVARGRCYLNYRAATLEAFGCVGSSTPPAIAISPPLDYTCFDMSSNLCVTAKLLGLYLTP